MAVIFTLMQTNLFATKLDLANLKLELMDYNKREMQQLLDTDIKAMQGDIKALSSNLTRLMVKFGVPATKGMGYGD